MQQLRITTEHGQRRPQLVRSDAEELFAHVDRALCLFVQPGILDRDRSLPGDRRRDTLVALHERAKLLVPEDERSEDLCGAADHGHREVTAQSELRGHGPGRPPVRASARSGAHVSEANQVVVSKGRGQQFALAEQRERLESGAVRAGEGIAGIDGSVRVVEERADLCSHGVGRRVRHCLHRASSVELGEGGTAELVHGREQRSLFGELGAREFRVEVQRLHLRAQPVRFLQRGFRTDALLALAAERSRPPQPVDHPVDPRVIRLRSGLRGAGQQQWRVVKGVVTHFAVQDGRRVRRQRRVQHVRWQRAAAVLADDPRRQIRREYRVDHGFPVTHPIRGDGGIERPGHLDREANAAEAGGKRFRDHPAHVRRFRVGVQFTRQPPLLPGPQPERIARERARDVAAATLERGSHRAHGLIVGDVDAALAGSEARTNERHEHFELLGRVVFVEQTQVLALRQGLHFTEYLRIDHYARLPSVGSPAGPAPGG